MLTYVGNRELKEAPKPYPPTRQRENRPTHVPEPGQCRQSARSQGWRSHRGGERASEGCVGWEGNPGASIDQKSRGLEP